MLHLRHCSCLSPHTPSLTSIDNRKKLIFLYGFDNELLGFKKSKRNGSLKAVERDSEFEVDPDKAREALKKLDEQLQSLSKKQVSPPKIRALDLNKSSPRAQEETSSEFTESFLAYVASALLVFTILYNVIFVTIIKPSIDGPELVPSASVVKEAQRGAEFPFGP